MARKIQPHVNDLTTMSIGYARPRVENNVCLGSVAPPANVAMRARSEGAAHARDARACGAERPHANPCSGIAGRTADRNAKR